MSHQSDELNSIVTAVNEMNASVSDVSRSAVDVASVVAAAHQTGQSGLHEIQHVIELTEQLTEQVQQSHSSTQELANEISDIRNLVDVIRGVAEQTNLLALNAAIEAARAGESGRGFAVVADEVRQLAVRTQESTHLIEDVITAVGTQSVKTVETIDASLQRVQHARQSVQSVGSNIEVIAKAIDDVNGEMASVSSATEQQAAMANTVDKSLLNVRDTGQQTLEGARDITTSSKDVAQVAEQLKGMLDKFKV
jgi:methyl-accepting chemotaxis protein